MSKPVGMRLTQATNGNGNGNGNGTATGTATGTGTAMATGTATAAAPCRPSWPGGRRMTGGGRRLGVRRRAAAWELGQGAAGRAAAGVALAVLVVAAGGCAHRHTAAVGWRPAEAGVGGGVQAALRKRERFGYRRADALAVERRVTRARAGMVVEDVRMAVRDPLGRLGRFEQRFIHYRWAGGGARPTVVVCPLFGDGMLLTSWWRGASAGAASTRWSCCRRSSPGM